MKIKSQPGYRCDVVKGILFKKRGEVFKSDMKDNFSGEVERDVFVVRVNNELLGYCTRYSHAVDMLLKKMGVLEGVISE